MGLTIVVKLYTSRVLLKSLGVDDFGIFNVVGGLVVMMSFLNTSMATSTQRFLSFEMGKGSYKSIQRVFSTSVSIHVLLALLIFIFAETAGLYLFREYIVLPQDRYLAASWVYHCSVLTLLINFLYVPYNASIIASEKMNIYAYISIIEVLLQLFIVFLINRSPFDNLVTYSVLLTSVSLVVCIIYIVYCRSKFKYCRYTFLLDKKLLKQMANNSFWMLFGTSANLLSTQGINILMNIFFGVTINASRAIAIQVRSAVYVFISNFMIATQPQITKRYSSGQIEESFKLVLASSRFSFVMMYILVLPLLLNTDFILSTWLGELPNNVILFTQLVLIELASTSLYPPLSALSLATGKIRKFQLIVSASFLLVFIITYLFYKEGYPPYITFIISSVIYFISVVFRVLVLDRQIGFKFKVYMSKVLVPIFLFTIISSLVPSALSIYLDQSFFSLIFSVVTSSISIGICAYYFVCTKAERLMVFTFLKNNYNKYINRL